MRYEDPVHINQLCDLINASRKLEATRYAFNMSIRVIVVLKIYNGWLSKHGSIPSPVVSGGLYLSVKTFRSRKVPERVIVSRDRKT